MILVYTCERCHEDTGAPSWVSKSRHVTIDGNLELQHASHPICPSCGGDCAVKDGQGIVITGAVKS
jgi:hypothetical protein